MVADGAVNLYYDGSNKLKTTSGGVEVTGILDADRVDCDGLFHLQYASSTNTNYMSSMSNNNGIMHLFRGDGLYIGDNMNTSNQAGGPNNQKIILKTNGTVKVVDNCKLVAGDSDDLEIYHNGSHSIIHNNGTGDLKLIGEDVIIQASNDETMAKFIMNGAVELYYNNVAVLQTRPEGIKLHNGTSTQIWFYDVNTATMRIYTNGQDLRWYADVDNDAIAELQQDGDFIIDGSFYTSGVDYAEYFESTDGSAIPLGTTVVLENGKIRAATSSETPIGVIRPKTSGTSVTGGSHDFNWQGKYLVDDYDGHVLENGIHCTWTDSDGNNQQCWKDRVPTGVTIPDDAEETTIERRKLNPDFNESKTYVPRSERTEWNCVGLLGQIPITKGQPTSSNWIKMKDRTSTVELWMVK